MSLKCNKCGKELQKDEQVYQVRFGYMIPTNEGVEFEPEEEVLLQHADCVQEKVVKYKTAILVPDFT